MVKAIGGAAASLVAAGLILEGSSNHGFVALILDAAIIALSANFFNLLDLRPGRSGKVGIALFVIIALLAKFDVALVPAAIVVGAVAGLILDDLHERLMLGDTGANALGAAIGFGLATQLTGGMRLIGFVALLGLNLLSEVVSYTKLIDNFGPLRMLDQIGRRRTPPIDVRDHAAPGGRSMTAEQEDGPNRPATPPYSASRPPMSADTDDTKTPWESPFAGVDNGRSDADELFDRPRDKSSEPSRDTLGDAQEGDDDRLDLRFDSDQYNGHDIETSPNAFPKGTSHRSDRI